MQFLTPLFLAATALLAVPVVLHLTRRETRNPIPFASLMFLQRIPVQEVRRRRLRSLLLLAMRCLGILLLVLAFARPVLDQSWLGAFQASGSRAVVILLDDSLSMRAEGVWARAIDAARKQVSALQADDEAALILFGESSRLVSDFDEGKQRLAGELSGLEPGWEGTDYGRSLIAAVERLRDRNRPLRKIVLIADLQSSGLESLQDLKFPENIQFEAVDVGADLQNVFIEEARMDRHLFDGKTVQPASVRIASSPARAGLQGAVQLFLEGTPIDRQSFALGEDGASTVTFAPFEIDEGIHRGRFELADGGDLPGDDVFHFVVENSAPFEVQILTESRSVSGAYLENALSSGSNLPFRTSRSPSDAARVLLVDNLRRPPAARNAIRHLEQGGGVIVVLGESVDESAYHPEWDEILPARLKEREYVRSGSRAFTSLTDIAWEHPVFSIFQERQKAGWFDVRIFGYWRVDVKPESVVAARFAGGDPALVEGRYGNGKIFLLATSADRVWTDFPLRGVFLPFWQRLVLDASQWERRPAAFRVGDAVALTRSQQDRTPGATRDWDVLAPDRQRVFGLDEEGAPFFRVTQPGFYEIRQQRGTDWAAVNADSRESILSRIPPQEFLAAVESRRVGPEQRPDSIHAAAMDRTERAFSWWLVLLAG
ncbi:MAG TPA: BatA domain-containing protein, partial [Acidobacteriota bacterium]|nr:BatA domain-containing protein [Acidobacteriota bacterium]